MTLPDWEANGWLRPHEPSRQEVGDLLAVVERDLEDARIDRLSADWRLSISYNAALQLASLALAVSGYRTGHTRAHERAIQSLRYTVGVEPDIVDMLDAVRRKRNLSNYDRAGTTSDREAEEVFELVLALREAVLAWLRSFHGDTY